MNPLNSRHSKLLIAVITLAITLTTFTGAPAQQRQQQQPSNNTDSQRSIISDIFSLGSTVVSSAVSTATGSLQYDPYEQFRGAHYSNAGLMSERDEVRLGNQFHLEVGKHVQFTTVGQERVNSIGQRVARSSLRPGLLYKFHVIQSRELNAFSTPGGHVYVTDALVEIANDDELASVLSHEIGHVVARHSLKRLQQSQALGDLANVFGSITGIAGQTAGELGTAAAQAVAGGLLASHSRDEEREADYLGVHGAAKAGFDPEGMVTMLRKVQQIAHSEPSILGSIFSDHPDAQERIDNTQYEIARIRATPVRTRRQR
ncbi:MAG TPA: M48 family metallopeptidase [Pyrinomonadaceae bacterium]|nr:M48 family metallopeptidase [Pyrinomonadaceae bacterium]